jgi:hypothetical protein
MANQQVKFKVLHESRFVIMSCDGFVHTVWESGVALQQIEVRLRYWNRTINDPEVQLYVVEHVTILNQKGQKVI